MNKIFILLILILLCSSVFAFSFSHSYKLQNKVKTTDFMFSNGSLVYAPVEFKYFPNGRIGIKPVSGCYNKICLTACESANIRELFLWGCN